MSSCQPYNWNVVVNASWNPAILTPGGIATKLFNLPKGSRVEVLVPIEGLEPPKVVYGGLSVIANSSRLIVDTQTHDFCNLKKAMGIACTALSSLPETPVYAAGFNIGYKGDQIHSELSEFIQCPLHELSDCGYEINSYGINRQIIFRSGVINLGVSITNEGEIKLELNFHKESTLQDDLKNWLSISEEDIKAEVNKITSALHVTIMEESDAKSI